MRRLLEEALPFRKLVDLGIVEYREFACSRATFRWLAGGGMRSVDGVPVTLFVADDCDGGPNVIVQARPAVWEIKSGTYSWQEAA